MWATENQAGLKLEDDDGNSSFLDTGNIWLKFDYGADYTHGYPGYFRLQFESGEYSNLYGGGLYINDSENWVQIDPPGENAFFQKVLLGDMSRRWVLCSGQSSETLTCEDLPDPLVKNVRAKKIESHISPLNLCGASDTYLDLANPFLQIAALGAAIKVTIEPDTIWVSDPDQSLSVEPHAINIISSAGSSEFSDTYLHVSRNTGAYASFDGAGWLELKNSAGKVIYLDPTKIEFTNGAKIATHDADGYTAINGPSNFAYYRADVANLVTSSNEGSFRADRLEITQTSGGVSARLSVNSGSGTLSVENSNGGKGTYQATLAKLEDSIGDSTLTTQSLHLNRSSGSYATFSGAGWLELKNSAGKEIYLDPTKIVFTDGSKTSTHDAQGITSTNGNAYATVDGSGWLELKNAAGKEIYLDPTEIVFTDGGKTSTHNADGFTASEGSDSGNLNCEELWMTLGGVGTTRVMGGSVTISKSNGGICVIEPPAGQSAYFQKVNYIDSSFDVREITVLTTSPIPSGVFDPCQKVVQCVLDSQTFPTWAEANATYVDWTTFDTTLLSYPTWGEANATYVDWASFSQVPAYVGSLITNALLGLGIEAQCDADGNLHIKLTGLPSTSSNTPNWPTGPGTLT
jgi:hypothetical protein